MFRLRQSSDIFGESGRSVAKLTPRVRVLAVGCMQTSPQWSALSTPVQCATGCGAFQRSGPTGGAPKGMPRNSVTPGAEPGMPETRPSVVCTGLVRAAWAAGAAAIRAHAAAAHRNLSQEIMTQPFVLPRAGLAPAYVGRSTGPTTCEGDPGPP